MRSRVIFVAFISVFLLAGCLSGSAGIPYLKPDPVYELPLNETVSARHVSAIYTAGNVTVVSNLTISGGGNKHVIDRMERIDVRTGRISQRITQTVTEGGNELTGENITYTDANGTSYKRFTKNGQFVKYVRSSDSGRHLRIIDTYSEYFQGGNEFEYRGTTKVDGVRTYVYVIPDVEQLSKDPRQHNEGDLRDDLLSFTLRMHITDTGLIKRVDTRTKVDYKEEVVITSHLVVTFKSVGSTTVTEPEWLDEAK